MAKYALAALALLTLMTGCDSGTYLRDLREARPTGDAYSKALATDYLEYAERKEAAYDWAASQYFAEKGLFAAEGKDITPEEPQRWDLSGSPLAELEAERARLVQALEQNRTVQPEMAASAMVAYDAWLELVHSDAEDARIAEQKAAYAAIVTKLSEVHTATPGLPTTTTPPESTSTVLYFPFDSDQLGDSAQSVLAELVRYVNANNGAIVININGHADRSGTEQYNMDLSERRAKFVLKTLHADGVPLSIMRYFAFGESDPAVPTDDGVREPRNRRVEIYIE